MCWLPVYLVSSQTGATHLTRGASSSSSSCNPTPTLPLPSFHRSPSGVFPRAPEISSKGAKCQERLCLCALPHYTPPRNWTDLQGQPAGPTLVSTEPRPADAGTAGFAPETGTGRITSRLAKAPCPISLDETVGHGVGWSHAVSVTVRCSTT